jgi:serine/threonine protein kinase
LCSSEPAGEPIFDQFHEAGRQYLVMEFIVGQTLESYLAAHAGTLPVAETLRIALQLCNVLDYLHTRQPPIIFRDLKPSNVMLTDEEHIYLIDFGIARHFKPGQMKDTIAFGSPGYAAPEQYGKAQTDPRSDIYSLGAMLHQMLSGHDPSETPFRFAPLAPSLPGGLEALVMQMVELDESKRPASADIIRQGLEFIAGLLGIAQPDLKAAATRSASPFQAEQPAPAPIQAGIAGAPNFAGAPLAARSPLRVKNHTTYQGHSDWVWDVAWAPDGSYIASASKDKTVRVWNPVTLQAIVNYRGHKNDVFAVAWSPDSKHLASASADCTVQVWDALTGKHAFICEGYTNAVIDVAWSPSGNQIVSGSGGQTVQIWNASTSDIHSLPSRSYTHKTLTRVYAVAWSPDGTRIAFGSEDGKVQVWRLGANNLYILTYSGHDNLVGAVAW